MNLNSMVLSLGDNPEMKDALSNLSAGDTVRVEITGLINEKTDKQVSVSIEEAEVIEDGEKPDAEMGGGEPEGESEGGGAMLMMGKAAEEED